MILIHEQNAAGQHRIVHIDDKKIVTHSEWVEGRELAQHKGFFANMDPGNGLPPVFRVSEFEHQVVA